MPHKLQRGVRLHVVLLLGVALFVPAFARADVTVNEINSAALDDLNEDQKQVFTKVANQELCPCNCPLTLAGCLKQKPKCGKAQVLARYIARKTRDGLTTIDILTKLEEGFPGSAADPKQSFTKAPAANCKGSPTAKIHLVEFADFRCPHCREASHIMSELAASGKVEVCFKHYPLQALEPSVVAAEAAEAAAAQGKFWPYHDLLFKYQEDVGRDALLRYAGDLKLDVARFTKELDSHKYKAKVLADREEGNKANIQGTPAIFVGGHELKLDRTLEDIKDRTDYDDAAACSP